MKLPPEMDIFEITSVAVDSNDFVYTASPNKNPVSVFTRDGVFLKSWGKGFFSRVHDLFIDKDDQVFCVDDNGHTVMKFTKDGELLLILGKREVPSHTGCVNKDFRTIRQAGPPFCYPGGVATTSKGDIFVSDGYGNARVHKFSSEGEWLFSWGEPGSKDGQFHVPHDIAVSKDDLLYVADRENDRIQIFDEYGKFLGKISDVHRPDGLCIDADGLIYVAELGDRIGNKKMIRIPEADGPWSTVAIYDRYGKLLQRFGESDGRMLGSFFSAHGICVDSYGDLYVSEVIRTCMEGDPPVEGCHCIQKFKRT